ncbi:MAG: hypothetical protein ABEK50_06685 [bacterium]
MSPAAWILIFFVLLIIGTPGIVLLMENESTAGLSDNGSTDSSDGDDQTQPSAEESSHESASRNDSEVEQQKSHQGDSFDEINESEEPTHAPEREPDELEEESDHSEPSPETESRNFNDKYSFLYSMERPETFKTLESPQFNPESQSRYDDRDDPDKSSKDLKKAVEWLDEASTEAIHQAVKKEDFLESLKQFIQEPRAAGAESVAETPWRNRAPNLSRLIGERLLVLALGLSAEGPYEMNAHKQAFVELLSENWNDDGLDHPLVYQSIGRMGLLTCTSYVDLQKQLINLIPSRTPRSSNPGALELGRYHSLLLATAPGETYPFPRSDRGLSRLWHWDEHNPPLAEWTLLPAVLSSLWIHYNFQEAETDPANDFGALLGNWWDENEPSEGLFESQPAVWEALLLTAWVLIPDQHLIWNQIENRYGELNFESESLDEFTLTVLSWVDAYEETGDRPEQAPGSNQMPPLEWIKPLPSDLINDYSQPSFDFPETWCNAMSAVNVEDHMEEVKEDQ